MLNITSYCLEKNWQKSPNKPALIYISDTHQETLFTYHELYTSIAKLTQGLLSLSVPTGSRITIHSAKTIDFFLLFFSSMAAGLIPIPALSALTTDEIDYIIKSSQSLLIYEPDSIEHDPNIQKQCTFLSTNELLRLKAFPFKTLPRLTQAEDPAFMLYTSGSSAIPKAVLHAHRVILGREPLRKHWLNLDSTAVLLHTGKPCWTYSMGVGLMDTWVKQGTAIMYAGEESPHIWFELLQKYHVTHFASSPSVYKSLLQIKDPSRYNLTALRSACSAGEALPDICKEYWLKHFSSPIYEALGMSEISTFISTGPSIPIKPGTIGKPQPGRRMRVIAIEGDTQALPPNEIGLLAIHTDNPGFMLGYQFDQANNPEHYRGDWFISGDLVSQDEAGYISHHGRADNVINTHGHRVSCVEIEGVLLKFDGIDNVACCGETVSEDTLLVAFIEANGENTPFEPFAKKLFTFVKTYLSPNKRPHKLVFINHLPALKTGKIDRRKLSELQPLKTVICEY